LRNVTRWHSEQQLARKKRATFEICTIGGALHHHEVVMALATFILILAILLSGMLLMRFRKRWLAAFNIAVTNRLTGRFAARLPGFEIITHLGPQVRQSNFFSSPSLPQFLLTC
jgi:hypothetical protein